ncbi:MAG: MotA/TolQ/ExbB proton channel family protein [Candidatus Thermoplasmatota archaeon]|nr:MotA/TolQ/ExbB proton channel family protein [Candidatus Thermoplasmatota archaeon]
MNPELSQDLSLLHLVLNASVPVQLVMLLLLGASLLSWWFIFIKLFSLKRALRATDRFEREFWGGGDLNALYRRVAAERESAGEMERIFEAGFREFMKLRQQAGLSLNVIVDGTRRAMRATYQRELDGLESHLSFLATVGSVSPYVGASLVVRQELMRGSTCLAKAVITLACVDAVNFKPVKMPATILQALTHTT